MAVPLSPLSVTVTSRGGALGAEGRGQKSHLNLFFSYLLHPHCPPMLICDAGNKELIINLKAIYMSATNVTKLVCQGHFFLRFGAMKTTKTQWDQRGK